MQYFANLAAAWDFKISFSAAFACEEHVANVMHIKGLYGKEARNCRGLLNR